MKSRPRRGHSWCGSLLSKGFHKAAHHVFHCQLAIKSCICCLILGYIELAIKGQLPAWAHCIQEDEFSGTWLVLQDGSAHFGCKVCNAAGRDSDWGRISIADAASAHVWRLRRRVNTQSHQVALTSAGTGSWKSLVSVNGRQVPEAEIFCELFRGEKPNDVKRWKLRKLKQCAGEAVRRFNVQKLQACSSLSIRQDCGNGWLAICFVGASQSLSVVKGLLGAIDMSTFFDQTSESIYEGMLTIFERAATENLNMPGPSKLNEDAQAHIHGITELTMFVSDAAADEVLVGRMLKKRTLNDVFVDPNFFPNMCHRLNDRAHAFRRVTKRGWSD